MPTRPKQCPKCSGLLVYDYETRCLNCGLRPPVVSTNLTLSHPQKNPALKSTSPSARVDAAISGESCLEKAFCALGSLGEPFWVTYQQEEGSLIGLAPVPSPLVQPLNTELSPGFADDHEDWMRRWEKIISFVALVPHQPTIGQVWQLIRCCDSRTRESVKFCDSLIQDFNIAIEREQQRLHTLRKTVAQPTLFSFHLTYSLADHCDHVQKQIDRARPIVTQAQYYLKPAAQFFLSKRSPSRSTAKRMLIEMLAKFTDLKTAAKQAATLLNLADPQLSVTPEGIRQLRYPRFRPRS